MMSHPLLPKLKELRSAAQSTGMPLLALAAGLIPHYFLLAHPETDIQEPAHLLAMAATYCLRFTLTLAVQYPDLARSYRELIPSPHASPSRRRSQKRRPKTP